MINRYAFFNKNGVANSYACFNKKSVANLTKTAWSIITYVTGKIVRPIVRHILTKPRPIVRHILTKKVKPIVRHISGKIALPIFRHILTKRPAQSLRMFQPEISWQIFTQQKGKFGMRSKKHCKKS